MILQQYQIQEFLRSHCKKFFITCTISSRNRFLHQPSFLSNSLTNNIYQIVLKVSIPSIPVGHRNHQTDSLYHLLRVIIIFHFRPTGDRINIQSRTGTEHRLMCSLLGQLLRSIIDRICQLAPGQLQSRFVFTITCFNISFQPVFFRKTLRTPRQLHQQFVHHRIVFYPFGCHAYSFQSSAGPEIFFR